MKKLFALIAFSALPAGCNTIEGGGKDIRKGGDVIEKAADKARH